MLHLSSGFAQSHTHIDELAGLREHTEAAHGKCSSFRQADVPPRVRPGSGQMRAWAPGGSYGGIANAHWILVPHPSFWVPSGTQRFGLGFFVW